MPNMINCKVYHSLVVVKNNLFVIAWGTASCDVFRSLCKKCVAIKSPTTSFLDLNQAISNLSKVYSFQNNSSSIFCYDVDKDEWSEELF